MDHATFSKHITRCSYVYEMKADADIVKVLKNRSGEIMGPVSIDIHRELNKMHLDTGDTTMRVAHDENDKLKPLYMSVRV